MVEKAKRMALRHQLAKGGDRVVIMAGIPFGTAGSTNVLHVVRLIGDELERHSRRTSSARQQRGNLVGDLAGEEADRPDFLRKRCAGLAVQPHGPEQGVERLGAAREQAADDARRARRRCPKRRGPARRRRRSRPRRPGVTTWLVTPLTSTIER